MLISSFGCRDRIRISLEHYISGLAQTTTLKYSHHSEKTMQLNKTTIILTTAILILAILTAGCTDTGGANPETTTYTPPPQEESPVVEETAAAEPAPEPVETPWYVERTGFEDAQVGTYSTLFGKDITGVKNYVIGGGTYSMYDMETSIRIFTHQEFTPSNLRLDLELSSDQYRTLIDQYGSMISVTMETIDLDQDGAMDKVAVKYVGTESVLEFEMDYREGATIKNYLKMYIVYLS